MRSSKVEQKLQEKGVGRRTQKSKLMCIWLEIWLKCSTSVPHFLNRSAAGDQEGQELRSCGKHKGRSRGFSGKWELKVQFWPWNFWIHTYRSCKSISKYRGETFLSYPVVTSKSSDFSIVLCLFLILWYNFCLGCQCWRDVWKPPLRSDLMALHPNTSLALTADEHKGNNFYGPADLIITTASQMCCLCASVWGKKTGQCAQGFSVALLNQTLEI